LGDVGRAPGHRCTDIRGSIRFSTSQPPRIRPRRLMHHTVKDPPRQKFGQTNPPTGDKAEKT
jgi:hypothetical protein